MDQEVHCNVSPRRVAEHVHEPRLYAASVEAADYVKDTPL